MSKLQIIKTIPDVIKELGGIEKVRELTGRGQSAVLMWKHRNRFPSKTYATIQTALQKRGRIAPNSLWDMQ